MGQIKSDTLKLPVNILEKVIFDLNFKDYLENENYELYNIIKSKDTLLNLKDSSINIINQKYKNTLNTVGLLRNNDSLNKITISNLYSLNSRTTTLLKKQRNTTNFYKKTTFGLSLLITGFLISKL